MRHNYYTFGINPRATTIVAKMVEAQDFSPEWYLDELDRRGMGETCRILGHFTLDMLRIWHSDPMDRYPLFLAPDVVVMERDANVTELPPSDFRGEMQARRVAVGLSSSGLALQIMPCDSRESGISSRLLLFAELEAMGIEPAALTIGDHILRTLAHLLPDAFAPFHRLSYRPEKGDA